MAEQSRPVSPSRRKMVLSGSALATTAWVAPSVTRLDRVAAAVGTCGIAPLQVDWSAFTGTFPSSVTAADGTQVTITTADPANVGNANFLGLVFNGTLNGLQNPLLMAMDGATNGDFTAVTFQFSRPVALCFSMLDVDFGDFPTGWEDTIEFAGTLGGANVDLTAADIVTSSGNIVTGTNTVLGTANVAQTSTNGQIDITYPSPIDQVTIRHIDVSTRTGFQYVGIHDLHWCP